MNSSPKNMFLIFGGGWVGVKLIIHQHPLEKFLAQLLQIHYNKSMLKQAYYGWR